MTIQNFKEILTHLPELGFKTPNGNAIPEHFHITELGIITKHFIDCGGTVRTESHANFQLWVANDTEHRLTPEKLLQIINHSEKHFALDALDIEVEYQGETIGKYGIDFTGSAFTLIPKQTNCLALDNCGIPKQKRALNTITANEPCCTPDGNCCI
ncbi:DUF6428 family protein [Flavobacterium sp.]|uniref:DUF6428 family protein n=1 Tax=Flavobacterium sp. TaxID=239 RepID=UPI003B9A150A